MNALASGGVVSRALARASSTRNADDRRSVTSTSARGRARRSTRDASAWTRAREGVDARAGAWSRVGSRASLARRRRARGTEWTRLEVHIARGKGAQQRKRQDAARGGERGARDDGGRGGGVRKLEHGFLYGVDSIESYASGDGLDFVFASDGGPALSAASVAGAAIWGLALYFASPVSVIMLFLGRTDSERPSDWLLRKVTGIAQMEDASVGAKVAVAAWFLVAGVAASVVGDAAFGDSTWQISVD